MAAENKRHIDRNRLILAGLAAALVFAYLETSRAWTLEQPWADLLALPGLAAILLFTFLFLLGVIALILNAWSASSFAGITLGSEGRITLRWIIASVLVLFTAWIYLYTPWGALLSGAWTQFVFACGLASLIARVMAKDGRRSLSGNELALAFGLFLYPRVVQELRIIFPVSAVSRAGALAGFVFILGLLVLLYSPAGEKGWAVLTAWRGRLSPVLRWLLIILLLGTPLIFCYGIATGGYILYPNIRFAVVLLALWLSAFLLSPGSERLIQPELLALCAGILVLVSALTGSLLMVVDLPFSLSWSEGNRLYDYSLVFGQHLYDYPGVIINPYSSPGRYGLWGVLFLIKGLPIWAHRLWNVLLLFVPPLIFAALITRRLKPSQVRLGWLLWVAAFFIILAPVHPPFMVVCILIAIAAFDPSLLRRVLLLGLASFYAGLSRWTWALAPGVIAVLIDLLLYYPQRQGSWLRRLWPAVLSGLAGMLPGLIPSMNQYVAASAGQTLSTEQPLLWYRLLPNETLSTGVLPLAILTTGPVLLLLAWWMLSRRWKVDWLQGLAVWTVLAGYFAAGLVISTKIGGGGDLHNLDMYLASLIVVTVIGYAAQAREAGGKEWPDLAVGLVLLLALLPVRPFTPFNSSAGYSPRLDLPAQKDVENTLQSIRSEVQSASQRGEVLFMDQRQLLTFGYVDSIPFVPEYEKKYMMDQSMAGNAEYFIPYYRDLANKRFTLIVTEVLKVNLKGDGVFSEENDVWVKWVSAPTLCFYEPIMTEKSVGVQMLVPRQNPTGCEKYLQQAGP